MDGVLDYCMVTAHIEGVKEPCVKQALPSKNLRI